MPRKGLTKELVVDAAVQLIEEKGSQAFSINELARQLDIKPASLYNHIQNMEELSNEVGSRIAAMLRDTEHEAIAGKMRDEAFYGLSHAHRSFAKNHMELYKINIGRQLVGNDFVKMEKGEIIDPMRKVLADYGFEEKELMAWHRIWRSMMNGHITQEYAAPPKKCKVDFDKTYQMAMDTVLLGIHTAEKKKEERGKKHE